MLLKTIKGMYQIQYNYKDALNLEDFTSKYIEECFDSYTYIVGDISSGILRLKGFDTKPQSDSNYKNIEKYLEVSCAFGCPFFILKRMANEEEYDKLSENEKIVRVDPLFVIPSIEKENYDKESLELESSQKSKPRIELNMKRLTTVPQTAPFSDVEEFIKQDKQVSTKEKKQKPQANVTSYVSSSPDFDPSKKAKFNNKNGNTNSFNNNSNKNRTNANNRNKQNQNSQGSELNNQANKGPKPSAGQSPDNRENRNNRNNHRQKNKNFKPNGVRKEQNNG